MPLFPRRDPVAAYTTLDAALRHGLAITETSAAGSVPELVVANPLDEWVLLYDGEELVGAKQNRILNLTVLVAAGSVTPIPVSCVEAGRWHRRSQTFAAARHTAGPGLRLRKARALGADALARGRGQHEVWDAVAEQATRRGVASPTAAHADMFAQHEGALAELREAFPARPGQCGVILVLPDGHVCLDYLSRPDAYAEHHRKLVDGYLWTRSTSSICPRPASSPRTGCCTGSRSCRSRGARRPASASTCGRRRRACRRPVSSTRASCCSSRRTPEQGLITRHAEPADARVLPLSCRAASKSCWAASRS